MLPTTGWTCEIGWHAGLRSAAFRATAEAPGEAGRLIAQSGPLQWPPLMRPLEIPELDDALRTLEQRLLHAGWMPVDGGAEWYRRRFAWTGTDVPDALGTVTAAEPGWTCEITWKGGLRGAGFRALALAPDESRHVVARSETLEWPPFVPPYPSPEVIAAAKAVERTLVDAGWSPIGCGPSWYALRFAWRREGTPDPLGTAVAGADPQREGTPDPLGTAVAGADPEPEAVEATGQRHLAETIAGLREQGMTWREVCRRTGIPNATVGRGLLRAGGRGDLIGQGDGKG